MKLKSPYLVKPGVKFHLSAASTGDQGAFRGKDDAEKAMGRYRKQLDALQEVFYASQAKAILVVLQGMDTAGKDGAIRSIFSGINPQGCQVAAFKVPTLLEVRHDFLWRCQAQAPPRGMIGIFNRSHYEDVLSPVVHGLMNEKTARRHMDDINAWEEMLIDNNTVILKFFLNISQDEQTRRLQARIDDPEKHWKLSASDFAERRFWADYSDRYEEILRHTSTKHAPWFVIPADHKWFRDVAISAILVEAMQSLKLEYPKPTMDASALQLENVSPANATKEAKHPDAVENGPEKSGSKKMSKRDRKRSAKHGGTDEPNGAATVASSNKSETGIDQ